MSERLNPEVIAVDSAEEAFQDQPVVIVCANATGPEPVMKAQWLSDPTFVCGVGSTRLESIEIDLDTFRGSHLAVMDTDHAAEEAGDLRQALENRVIDLENIWNLAQLVERKPDRPTAGVTVFKSVGSGLQDLAVATGYYEGLQSRKDLNQVQGLASLKIPKVWG